MKYATIKDDIAKNPMLLVEMPERKSFEQKEIRFFTSKESALIIEESARTFKTGKPVYSNGDAFVLMLNTGLRMGELLGLRKTDWNKEDNALHIQRNLQSVKKRDGEGKATKGREFIYNTTKTYSGDRILPLNQNARGALERLCKLNPDNDYFICTRNGGVVPPERFERTFHRLLV